MKTMKYILAATLLAVLTGCTDFAQPFANIEQDVKTRPLAVILDPCNAAPGDTVTVTAYVYTPQPSLSFTWTGKLDYFETDYGFSSPGSRTVSLADYEIPGSMSTSPPDADGLVTHSFRFTVPYDALAASTLHPPLADVSDYDSAVRTILGIPAGVDEIPNAIFDSLIRANAFNMNAFGTVPPELGLGIDLYTTGMQLEATVNCEVTLVLERTLAVSYSSSYHTPNFNTNPVINDIAIISIDTDEEITNLDDLTGVTYDSVLLYSRLNPVTEPESVLIDVERKYYLVYTHDEEQVFSYFSVNDTTIKTAEETYDHDWCYSNLDPSAQVQDSLIIVSGSQLIPPRATDMHNFRLYLLLHDYRSEYGKTMGTGTAFAETYGFFKYSDTYKRKH